MNGYVGVEQLKVSDFRGLHKANLERFTGVNILVGRNGSGKSSILEALYIALTLDNGLSYVVKRRGWFGLASVESLFHHNSKKISIEVSLQGNIKEHVVIESTAPYADDFNVLKDRGLNTAKLMALRLSAGGKVVRRARFYIDSDGKYQSVVERGMDTVSVCDSVFLDWNSVHTYGKPEDIFSLMMREGGEEAKRAVVKVLQTEYDELRDIAVLQVHDVWVLHLAFRDRAIPYYVVGDGVRYALAYLMIVLRPRKAVLLLEEPELHMHPSLMRITARAILRSFTERRNQVFISTHSLEFIKDMIKEAAGLGLRDKDFKIYRLRLVANELDSETYTLSEAQEVIEKLEWDLRR